jgi:hypothetical protein
MVFAGAVKVQSVQQAPGRKSLHGEGEGEGADADDRPMSGRPAIAFRVGPPKSRIELKRVTHEELRDARSSQHALTL